jgi:hypothetical protein
MRQIIYFSLLIGSACYTAQNQPTLADRVKLLKSGIREECDHNRWYIEPPHAYKSIMAQLLHNKPIDIHAEPNCISHRFPDNMQKSGAIRALWHIDKAVTLAIYGIFANISVIGWHKTSENSNELVLEWAPEYFTLVCNRDGTYGKPCYSWPDKDFENFDTIAPLWCRPEQGYRPLPAEYKQRVYTLQPDGDVIRQRPAISFQRQKKINEFARSGISAECMFPAPAKLFQADTSDTVEKILSRDMQNYRWELEDLIAVLAYADKSENHDSFEATPHDRNNIKAVLHNLIRYENRIPEIG